MYINVDVQAEPDGKQAIVSAPVDLDLRQGTSWDLIELMLAKASAALERSTQEKYEGSAIVASAPKMISTTMISIKVNPLFVIVLK